MSSSTTTIEAAMPMQMHHWAKLSPVVSKMRSRKSSAVIATIASRAMP